MIVDLHLRNYRGFSDAHAAAFRFGSGFTALVGPNNSGKSSLLRFLHDFRSLFEMIREPGRMAQFSKGEPHGYSPASIPWEGLFHKGNDRAIGIDIVARPNQDDPSNEVKLEIRYDRDQRLDVRHTPPGASSGLGPAVTYPDENLNAVVGALSDTLYVGAFRNILNFAPTPLIGGSFENPVYYDLRMGKQFVEWWGDWKSGRNRSGNETAYRLTQDIARIFGLQSLEINTTPGAHELQLFVDGRSYRLDELGSGLTQFMVVLANAASRRPAWILIDEPELNLHPALQLDFLTTLASYARIGVIFATHSIGLARSLGERIYALSRGPDGVQHVHPFAAVRSLAEFLGELSFSAHRELGFESVLLVEGTTDVPVIQQLLRPFGKEREVVLLPLGGTGVINGRSGNQLAEITRISPKISALIDSERSEANAPLSPDRQAFVENCQQLGIRCHVLERRAIENYLPERAIRAVKGDRYRALGAFDLLKDLPLGWAKSDNWRIAAEALPGEFSGTDLQDFLSKL
jgi:ABC-type Mn2+/Zn2+ transport system ATPase subunit